ncbi:MAG: HNH endonuclease [Chitinophagaceae bacterium]
MSSIFKSFSRLDAAVDFASIDEGLFLLMLNPDSNHILLQLILDEYFSETKHNFNNSQRSQQRIFEDIESKILHEDPAEYRREIIELIAQKDEEEIFLRGSLFKTEIPRIYNNTCAISGMKIDATINLSMVDACHIIPFSESYNDTITNGIALCPNLHRAFDRGLIGIDEGYCVIVNNNFIEFPGSAYQIKAFEGKKIYLPKNICYWPGKENFGNHRERWGLKGKNNFT